MAESDSDLEIIDELPSQRSSVSKHVFEDASEDELLDLDDNDDIIMFSQSSSNGRTLKSKKRKSTGSISSKKKISLVVPQEVVLSDDDDENENLERRSLAGSDATEVVRDDDLDSLPSISPPSPPLASKVTDNDNDNIIDYDVDGRRNSYHMYPSSSGSGTTTTQTTSSKGSSQNSSFADGDAQKVDDMFQDAEYASLADYLADFDTKKAKKFPTFPESNKKGCSSGKKTSVIPSLTDFARQQTLSSGFSSSKAKKDTRGRSPDDIVKEVEESYQVNKKSKQRSRTKKNNGEKVMSSSSACSSVSVAPPPLKNDQVPERLKKPKDVLKMITLQIAESVLSEELTAKLIEKEIQFQIMDSPPVADSIQFEHSVSYKMVERDLQVREKVLKEIDANIAIIFSIEKHLELLQGELDRVEDISSETSKSLTEWIQDIHRKNPGKKITLLIQGLDAYLRKIQRAVQKEYRDRVLKADKPDNGKRKRKVNSQQEIKLTRFEVQNAFISAQLETRMNYRLYENNSDLTLLLIQYAKSIGEAPYKLEKMKSTDFDWYAVADAVGGIPVEENGQAMRSLWIAQLTQFPGVGQESALAIARVYGSPKQLYQAYRLCSTVQEGKDLLTNIQVTMGVGPLAKTRRLGPEASKKIYRFFTSTDGEREIHV